jgi:hypothetical protein
MLPSQFNGDEAEYTVVDNSSGMGSEGVRNTSTRAMVRLNLFRRNKFRRITALNLGPRNPIYSIGIDPHGRPPCHFVRTTLVLIAADVETTAVSMGGAVLADIVFAVDLHDRTERERGWACHGVASTADMCARSCDAWMVAGLASDRVVAGHVRMQLAVLALGRFGRSGRLRRPQEEPHEYANGDND